MKKLSFTLGLLFFFAGISLFAQTDTKSYPPIINNGTIFLNGGIGYGSAINDNTEIGLPPITVGIDYALPISTLPFSVGLIAGVSSEKATANANINIDPSLVNLGFAFRLAYHINVFKVDALDTYFLLTTGAVLVFDNSNVFWGGLGLGGRYLFNSRIGAFLELGFNTVTRIAVGISCKF
jgi:hypothetical protein